MLVCGNCNADNEEDSRFCQACGVQLVYDDDSVIEVIEETASDDGMAGWEPKGMSGTRLESPAAARLRKLVSFIKGIGVIGGIGLCLFIAITGETNEAALLGLLVGAGVGIGIWVSTFILSGFAELVQSAYSIDRRIDAMARAGNGKNSMGGQ